MLAGIYDPRPSDTEAAARRRLRTAFGPEADVRARFVGPLAIISDRATPVDGAGCVLEGSLYNRRELAVALGADPGTGAETLVVQAYLRWGERMLARLRGMFALVAWASGADEILLAQDQVGAGALFVHRSGSELVFASEIRDLLRLLPSTPAPDNSAIVHWLASEDFHDGLTMFSRVRRLGAGRRITVVRGAQDERRYWTPKYEPPFVGSRLEIAAQLRDALGNAVALRTRGTRSVGITLSGGFDSSAIASVAATFATTQQELFGYSTVFPDEPGMDDRDYLDVLATMLPLKNVRFRVEPGGALEVALEYLRDWQLPLNGPGWVTELPLVRRAAEDGVQVLLDGQGGDETFGIAPFLVADLMRGGRLLSAVSLVRHRFPGAREKASWRPTARVLMQFGLRPALPRMMYSTLRRLRGPDRYSPAFLNDEASRRLAEHGEGLRWARADDGPRWWMALRQLLIDDREAAGLGDFVRQRASWVGLEARPPLFDVDLITTTLRIPPEFRFDPYLDRPIGREALAGVLPDPIRLSRRKSNLAPLYHRGLTGPDLPLIRQLLGGDRLEIGQWTRREVVHSLIARPPRERAPGWYEWLNTVWACVTAECWLRSLSEPSFAEETLRHSRVPPLEYSLAL